MSIRDDIRKVIHSKLSIENVTAISNFPLKESCAICKCETILIEPVYIGIKGDGPLCQDCINHFAPEMLDELCEYKKTHPDTSAIEYKSSLDEDDWKTINNTLDALLLISEDLSKGAARGIVEAPAGHIGLLYLAKDLVRPERRQDESEKDYELRVKSFRIQKLQEKLRVETTERILMLKKYLVRLGLPQNNG